MFKLHEDLPDQKDKPVIDVFKQRPLQGETSQPAQPSTSEPLVQTSRRFAAKGVRKSQHHRNNPKAQHEPLWCLQSRAVKQNQNECIICTSLSSSSSSWAALNNNSVSLSSTPKDLHGCSESRQWSWHTDPAGHSSQDLCRSPWHPPALPSLPWHPAQGGCWQSSSCLHGPEQQAGEFLLTTALSSDDTVFALNIPFH